MGVKIAFGTDMLFDPAAAAKQGKMVTKLKNWFTPYEALKMVTSDNAELLMMSGPRHPYQEGPLGVIAEGAYADLILVDGNPLENLDLVGDAEASSDLYHEGRRHTQKYHRMTFCCRRLAQNACSSVRPARYAGNIVIHPPNNTMKAKYLMFKTSTFAGSISLMVLVSAVSAQDSSDTDLSQLSNADVSRSAPLASNGAAPHEKSADEIAKELSNPNSPLASLLFKQTYTSFDGSLPGASDQSSNVTLFQPVFPFPMGDTGTVNLFVRPALAYVWQQPVFNSVTGNFENRSGWADIGYDVALGKSYDNGLILIGGIQGTIPTNSDVSGGQWRLGPELAVFKIGERGFIGANPSHQWDIGGDNYQYSNTGLELFAGLYLPNAWTISTDSKWSFDWVNDQATMPINLTVRKVVKFGNLPVSFQAGVDYYAKSNDAFGQDWAINFSVTPVVPNFIYNAISR